MDINALRAQKLAEIEQASRQQAVDEVIALKQRYKQTSDLTYTFESGGQTVKAVFVTASVSQDLPNSYRIELIAPPIVIAEDQCYIIDQHGERQGARGITHKGAKENRIILDTIAVKPS